MVIAFGLLQIDLNRNMLFSIPVLLYTIHALVHGVLKTKTNTEVTRPLRGLNSIPTIIATHDIPSDLLFKRLKQWNGFRNIPTPEWQLCNPCVHNFGARTVWVPSVNICSVHIECTAGTAFNTFVLNLEAASSCSEAIPYRQDFVQDKCIPKEGRVFAKCSYHVHHVHCQQETNAKRKLAVSIFQTNTFRAVLCQPFSW